MKRILVPYDFSECAENALKQAAFIAGKTNAKLYLYHVADLHPYWGALSETDREAYLENIHIVNNVIEKFAIVEKGLKEQGLTVITKYTAGRVIEKIVQYANSNDFDLLVMGTHGMSGIKEWVIGSNTQKILRQVSCPVLAIKHDLLIRDFKQIGFVTSLHQDNDQPFEQAMEFAQFFNAGITLINMDEAGFFIDPVLVVVEALKDYQKLAISKGIDCKIKRLAAGNLEKGLEEMISQNDIDLVIVPTHGKNAFVRIFASSIAEAIVNHLEKPVMTLRI